MMAVGALHWFLHDVFAETTLKILLTLELVDYLIFLDGLSASKCSKGLVFAGKRRVDHQLKVRLANFLNHVLNDLLMLILVP